MTHPMLELPDLTDPGQVSRYRFLLADGLGGYSLTTPAQTRTSSAQGLLVAALSPPERRHLMLARIDEAVLIPGGRRIDLDTHHYRGATTPDGFRHVRGLSIDPFPTTRFEVDGRVIDRTIFMPRGRAAVGVRYTLVEGGEVGLELRPQLAFREVHSLLQAGGGASPRIDAQGEVTRLQLFVGMPPLYWATGPATRLEGPPHWYYQVRYPDDQAAGQPGEEDLWNPGRVSTVLRPGRPFTVVAALDPDVVSSPEALWEEALASREALLHRAGALAADPIGRALVLAGDAFLVRAGEGEALLARYPAGDERFREAMIALPGLALVTGRHDVARAVIARFAPRLTAAAGVDPEAPAWMLYALDRYLRATGDTRLIELVWPVLKAVIAPLEAAPSDQAGEEQAALDAVWANGWTAGSRLAAALGEAAVSRGWAARATRIRRFYLVRSRAIPEPGARLTRAQVLSLSLPYPLFAGPSGWARAERLIDPSTQLAGLPVPLWGQCALALRRQRRLSGPALRRWIDPAIAHLLGPGLGQLSDPLTLEVDPPPLSAAAVAEVTLAYAATLELL
jgi:hypothetical protein